MKITEIAPSVKKIEKKQQTIYLVGTAHVSKESVDQVEKMIKEIQPDTICVELDQARYENLTKKAQFDNLDIFQVIKERKLPLFISQFVLSMVQKKMSQQTNSKPGMEFLKAIEMANEINAQVELIDRDVSITLKRVWRSLSFWQKMKLFASLFFFDDEELSEEKIESLKEKDMLNELIQELGKEFPEIKDRLIDERDIYMSHQIQHLSGEKIMVIIGAGHGPGILSYLSKDEIIPDEKIDEITQIPPKSKISKILPWIIPAIIIALFTWGFTRGNYQNAIQAMYAWIIINGSLSALGCLLAFAHPITIISGFIAAPITSLNPTIGAGFVTSIVQAIFVKPRVKDFIEIKEEGFSFRRWWKNRLTRIFLVFFLSSLGSAIGTWVALPYLAKIFK